MQYNNFNAIDEFSESEYEFEFNLYSDNLAEINNINEDVNSDSVNSDIII